MTNIPHIESKSFEPYLSQVGSLFDALRHAKETGSRADGQTPGKSISTPKSPESEQLLSPQSDTASQRSRPSSGHKNSVPLIAPLSTIPKVYFDENFRLENPRTFDVVSERSEVISSPSKAPNRSVPAVEGAPESRSTGRKALATNAILQEKLSWYLDTVEIHLISSISTASTSFFSALGSLRELHAQSSTSIEKIQALRGDLDKLDNDMAQGGLKVVNLRRRRENIRKLADAVCQLQEVVSSVTQCEKLAEIGDLEEALDELDDIERLLAGEQPLRPRRGLIVSDKLRDLRDIKALEGASDDLGQLRSRIGISYEGRFLDVLLMDLRKHVENVPVEDTLRRLGQAFQRSRGHRSVTSTMPAYMSLDSGMRTKLQGELSGLGRGGNTMTAATAFKTMVLREMKSLIRNHLPSSSDDDNESVMSSSTYNAGRQRTQQEKSSTLARNLRDLGPEDAYTMLAQIYTGVSEALRRLSVQVKVLLDITSGLDARSPTRSLASPSIETAMRSPQPSTAMIASDEMLQILDLSSLLGQAVDIVQSQIVKVLKVRAEQTSLLTPDQFLKYFSLNRLFAEECEAISGRSGAALKGVVDTQIKNFVSNFGDSWKHRIVQVMDSDKWDAKDFGDEEDARLSRVLAASTQDVEVWSATSQIWQISSTPSTNGNGSTNGANAPETTKARTALIDEQKYILPESAILMLKVIEEFQHFMSGIPKMIPDIVPILLECLKLFNSRSSQLILGAGATKSAGLKFIMTKHLALASQSLSFIIALIPYIREFIRRHITSPQLMGDFDKVKRLYQEHQSGIHEKLVDIMSSRASIHVNSMKKIDWEAERNVNAVSPYMEVLAKETNTLHRVLAKHLPELTTTMIMDPVFSSYKDQWTSAFQQVSLKSESAKQR